jgi:hypothetical protein
MTNRLRKRVFSHFLLHEDIEWYDLPEHDIGILCNVLNNDIPAVENVRFGTKNNPLLVSFILLYTCILYALYCK